MSSPAASAKITLTYPLYAADFDPQNSNFLIVGGGGGEGRSGVGNKIVSISCSLVPLLCRSYYLLETLLNISKKHQLSEVVDIDLSKNEDSVTSLAFAQSSEQWATAFAGINSSTAEQQKGKNEHLRSFLLEYPPRHKTVTNDSTTENEKAPDDYKGETKALGKSSLFTPSSAAKKETFQRILRLSRKKKSNGPRLGAIATGLAPEGEIVLFKADTSRPGPSDIRGRINLSRNEEAADVDIIKLDEVEGQEEGKFRVAYCTDYDIYVTDVDYDKKENGSESKSILSTPHPDASTSGKARPKFRSVRFITPQILLVLQNKPNGTGSELLLLEISGIVTLKKRLHKKIKSATALSVAHLDASSPSGIDQHAIAVAGADTSITLLTLDRFISSPKGKVKFRAHSFLPAVHPTSITSLAFSTYTPPDTVWKDTPAQYLKLASTSIANTCVVHTLPLSPYPSPPKPNTTARYLLTPPTRSNITQNTFSTLVALFAIALGAFFLQAFTEIRGGTPEYLGAKGWLSESVHDWIAKPYMFEDGYASAASDYLGGQMSAASASASAVSAAAAPTLHAVDSAAAKAQKKLGLRDLLQQRNMGSDTSDNANERTDIIVRHAPVEGGETALSAELRDPDEVVDWEHKAKRWEELAEHEKKAWKDRLVQSGQWTLEEGESVLKGIFFSGLGHVVGGIVG